MAQQALPVLDIGQVQPGGRLQAIMEGQQGAVLLPNVSDGVEVIVQGFITGVHQPAGGEHLMEHRAAQKPLVDAVELAERIDITVCGYEPAKGRGAGKRYSKIHPQEEYLQCRSKTRSS